MQQVGFGMFFLYPLFVYSCPTSLVKKYDLFSLLGTGQNLLGAWGRYERPWGGHFFIALKHGADTFFAVSSHGSDTFFHYHEANEKIFTETNAVGAIFFTEIADSD